MNKRIMYSNTSQNISVLLKEIKRAPNILWVEMIKFWGALYQEFVEQAFLERDYMGA